MDFIQGHDPDVMVLLFFYTPINFFRAGFSLFSEVLSRLLKTSDINDMITSTPTIAVSYETNLVHCLICAESLENTDRIAVFGRSQWDLRWPNTVFARALANAMQRARKDCKKEKHGFNKAVILFAQCFR